MKASVAERIVGRLTDFTEALGRGDVDRFTRRTVRLKLRPATYDPKLVRRTRKLLGASQAVFAQFLGVSHRTVRSWERGENTPSGTAARFMDEIRRDPRYWTKRLAESALAG